MSRSKRWLFALALVVTSLPAPAQAPAPTISADPKAITVTVSLTGSPMTGTCPYQMNLSWTASNASVCTKTGAWSGSGNASGSESVEVNAASQTYTLTCSSNTDSRTVSWTNPTQNTNGTAATITSNKVYHASSAANIESGTPITLTPAKTSYVLAGLPAGPRAVGVKATNAAGSDSLISNIATATITLPTGVDTVQAGCTTPPEPKPPTGVTIASTVWEILRTGTGQKVGRDVGLIDLGVACLGEAALIVQGPLEGPRTEYWGVPRDLVRIYRKPKSQVLLGQCALGASG